MISANEIGSHNLAGRDRVRRWADICRGGLHTSSEAGNQPCQ